MAMRGKFAMYEVVEVISAKSALRSIRGKKGIIRGISESEESPGVYAYAVDMPVSKTNWFILEADLTSTGRKVTPDQVEAGMRMAVNEKGESLDSDSEGS